MPEQDRQGSSFFSQDPGRDGVRCPICPGLIGATFQADCVCCGRQVAPSTTTTQPSDCKAEDLSKSVKALSIKSETVTSQPVQDNTPACSKTSNGRQRRRTVPVLQSCSSLDHQRLGSGGVRDGVGSTQGSQSLAGGGSRSATLIRIYQQPRHVVRPSPGPRRGSSSSSWGSAGRGTNGGTHHVFKGVRTRKGVKGFLVEIRPPKWKKTIWLGTYNTSIEAAGAYDAGVFYTKKPNTKYNLHSSSRAFPPLPPHLHLDRVDNMDEIKLFVQNQAREAARRVGTEAMCTTTTTTSQPSHYREELLACAETSVAVSSSSIVNSFKNEPATSSDSCITGVRTLFVNATDLPRTTSTCMDSASEQRLDSEFHIPMDMDYLGQCLHVETAEENMFLAYTSYLSQQGSVAPDQAQQLFSEEEEVDGEYVHHQLS